MKDKDRLQDTIAQHTEEFQEEKADRADIVQNMTRQYKDSQTFLIEKNKELENQIEKMTDQQGSKFLTFTFILISFLASLHLSYEKTMKEKDDIIAQKEKDIGELDRKMEDLADKFRSMLQTTLDKMSQKLKDGGEWEVGLLPDQEKLKQFGM